MMEIPETGLVFHVDQYVHGVWFVPLGAPGDPARACDWLACLWRELGHDHWFLRYRTRWLRDEQRDWQTFTAPLSQSEDAIAASVHAMAETVALWMGSRLCFVPIRSHGERAIEILQRQSWLRVQEVPCG